MIIAALAATALSAAPCTPLPGAQPIVSESSTRFVWVGEIHGTREHPALFADLLCTAEASGRPVVVALERDASEQPAWDAFLRSDGGAQARADLLKAPSWTYRLQDGRSSEAMLVLAETLRQAKAKGRVVDVGLILKPPPAGPPGPSDPGGHEHRMADEVQAIARGHPDALILVLSGNAHAAKAENTQAPQPYPFAATYLPASETVSVLIRGRPGSTWSCSGNECGPQPYSFENPHPREIVRDTSVRGYDAVAYTGAPTTASPPAALPPTVEKINPAG